MKDFFKNVFLKVKNFVLKNKWWTALIVIVLVSIFFIFFNKKPTVIESIVVERHNVIEQVSATGNVKPFSDLDLSFEAGGQVSRIPVSVGDKVYKGQFLISLSNADLLATVEQAKAGLKIAEANLSALKNGSTPEQVAVNESQVEKAKNDLANAKIDFINSVRDAYTKADDAVRNYTDIMFTNPRTQNVKLQFQTDDQQLENNLIEERISIENKLTTWSDSIKSLSDDSNFDSIFDTSKSNLNYIQTFLQNLAFAVNKLSPDNLVDQSTITIWKSDVSTARLGVDTAVNNLSVSKSQYQSALSALNIANSQLVLVKTGATADEISAQESLVEQAQANVNYAQARLNKSIIVSPINGVVTKIDAKVGQNIQGGVPAVSVISYGEYNVEAYIPEADISKIKIGDVATTTLDAYGSETFFETSVLNIDPGETVIESVPTYKITLKFASSSDTRIKSGMTSNLDILTAQKNNVLAVPSRSVFTIDSQRYVKLIDANDPTKTIDTKIEVGLRGEDGYVEIISGLKEGDKIMASPNF
ncbi:MAG: efflux RND transporter periplasmic adaptor subunit [Endomicrobiaceae bacterium]|nr:efflux RND transporter periplasmic adaptor subunit [Endomicrobiaceae bacterium]